LLYYDNVYHRDLHSFPTRRSSDLEYKESLGCEVCGETHPACLEFHHINPKEKRFSVGRLNDYLSVRLMKSEIAKCRLLCANCHRDRKSTRLNSSHSQISYAVFCLK